MNLKTVMIFLNFNNISLKGLSKLFIILTFIFQSFLFSEIIEIQSIHEVLPYIDPQTLVVFDIDNTLISTKQMAGGDVWFHYSLDKYASQGFGINEAVAKTLPDYMQLQHASEVVAVEDETPHLIHLLQKKGVFTLGLTGRSTELAYRTFAQLASVGIHLGKNSPRCQNLKLSSHFPLKYIEGILFVARAHKGESLLKVLDALEFPIERVVYIDDKMKFVKEVESVCEKMRIPYIGFRYGGFDPKVQDFDPKTAEIQHYYFDKILSNEDAKKLLELEKVSG